MTPQLFFFLLASACAPCHQSETANFARAGMTRALERGAANATLQAQIGGYSYKIDNNIYTVTDGKDTLRVPIEWTFGQGTAGRTYAFQRDGKWYESRVSYFSSFHNLDLTIGMQNITQHNLLEAAGRLAGPTEIGRCFDCHATNVVKSDIANMIPGVQCERCHGTTEAHLRTNAPMRKLGSLTTEEMSDFCGQCHRTWAEIAANGPHGIQNIRFQPYRLGNSKCYDAANPRISCTACHDPHRPLETSPAAYDAKCLACHSPQDCHVATKECVTCHMPRLDLPGAHKKFTDHNIRVVKANEPYPD